MNYGKELKRIRLKVKYSQEYVAEINGLSRTNYNKIENGKRVASMALLTKIFKSMGYTIDLKNIKNNSGKD